MRDIREMEPMNAQERFMYEMIVRQNVIIEQLSSIIEHIGKKDGVATQTGKVQSISDLTEPAVEEKPKRATRKKTVKE